jgi:hypothetical protein
MVVTKAELCGILTINQREEAERIESKIDSTLKKEYYSQGNKVHVHFDHTYDWPHERVRNAIKKKYKGAGWNIEFCEGYQGPGWGVTMS